MIRILPLLLLTACTSFPTVNAAAPRDSGARPDLLTAAQLADVLSFAKAEPPAQEAEDLLESADEDLRARADDLRMR